MQPHRKLPAQRPARQQGVVAIMFALMLVVLMGFAGLALDGGRLYVNRTELQNAADACALAAARVLPGAGAIPPATFDVAESAGQLVALRNRVDFQKTALTADAVTVEFSSAATGAAWWSAGAAPNNARFARCRVVPAAVTLWFMPVLGFASVGVSAQAAATPASPPNNALGAGGGGGGGGATVASLVQ